MSLVCQLPPSQRALHAAHKCAGDHECVQSEGDLRRYLFCQPSLYHACLLRLKNCNNSIFLDANVQTIWWSDELWLENYRNAHSLWNCTWLLEYPGNPQMSTTNLYFSSGLFSSWKSPLLSSRRSRKLPKKKQKHLKSLFARKKTMFIRYYIHQIRVYLWLILLGLH